MQDDAEARPVEQCVIDESELEGSLLLRHVPVLVYCHQATFVSAEAGEAEGMRKDQAPTAAC